MKILYKGEELNLEELIFRTKDGEVVMGKDGLWSQNVTDEDTFSCLTDALYRIEV